MEVMYLLKQLFSQFANDSGSIQVDAGQILKNAGTNAASIPQTVIGTKWGWAGVGGNPNYTGAYVSTTGAASTSFVSPCDKTITLNMLYGVDPGTFSPYLLVLKKKP